LIHVSLIEPFELLLYTCITNRALELLLYSIHVSLIEALELLLYSIHVSLIEALELLLYTCITNRGLELLLYTCITNRALELLLYLIHVSLTYVIVKFM